jgi:hypothetical protein
MMAATRAFSRASTRPLAVDRQPLRPDFAVVATLAPRDETVPGLPGPGGRRKMSAASFNFQMEEDR